ncbi:MAG: MarR family winged helix-turn-helix transcriptional regulator [Acidimicrobiales bacterium]
MVPRPATDRPGSPDVPALGRELALTAKAVRAWVDDAFARHGSSLATWILLQHAAASEQPPSQSQLAGSMSIGGATLVRHIDRLEADGLVRRDPDPRDRRVTRISLTPAGKEHFGELAEIARAVDGELRGLITEREERVFLSVLDRMRAHATQAAPSSEPDIAPTPEPTIGETEVA